MLKELRFRLGSARQARQLHAKIAGSEKRARILQKQVGNLQRRLEQAESGIRPGKVAPKNITWIFGTARTGSTWMATMLCHGRKCKMWREPFVGLLFGHLYFEKARSWQPESNQFVLGKPKEKWLPHVRRMVIDGASAATSLGSQGHVIVKEPNGSIGAPILTEAVPESRMIVMLRDPRDVIASTLDAELGDWIDPGTTRVPQKPDVIARQRSKKYMTYVGNALDAYEKHGGPKVLVRYEELRHRTHEVLAGVVKNLDLPHTEAEVDGAVGATAFEEIPAERKGSGKFYRKAQPGGWREDLTSGQIEIVEEVAGPLMDRLGYERVT